MASVALPAPRAAAPAPPPAPAPAPAARPPPSTNCFNDVRFMAGELGGGAEGWEGVEIGRKGTGARAGNSARGGVSPHPGPRTGRRRHPARARHIFYLSCAVRGRRARLHGARGPACWRARAKRASRPRVPRPPPPTPPRRPPEGRRRAQTHRRGPGASLRGGLVAGPAARAGVAIADARCTPLHSRRPTSTPPTLSHHRPSRRRPPTWWPSAPRMSAWRPSWRKHRKRLPSWPPHCCPVRWERVVRRGPVGRRR